ncbi:hypothetical protein BDP27DRAFT_1334971 [Rhodocollybia butyracea]|uniref:Uncharacterized protein n=1 Tax=Rhodocollybia butyracea TaxID=206335 RepID=A0A9P5U264_9AGAR|nr:hypothetical protein BDP27DRAFT_1334971 [Rhodocollybia butyracea]
MKTAALRTYNKKRGISNSNPRASVPSQTERNLTDDKAYQWRLQMSMGSRPPPPSRPPSTSPQFLVHFLGKTGQELSTTAYLLLHINAVNNALQKADCSEDVDPVIYVAPYNSANPSACCHVEVGDMRFLCPISGNVDPLFAFAFLQTFIDTLQEYLGTRCYQLFEETLDAGGHFLTTYSNALCDIVIPPSLLNKPL